jgi:hypothetical protein
MACQRHMPLSRAPRHDMPCVAWACWLPSFFDGLTGRQLCWSAAVAGRCAGFDHTLSVHNFKRRTVAQTALHLATAITVLRAPNLCAVCLCVTDGQVSSTFSRLALSPSRTCTSHSPRQQTSSTAATALIRFAQGGKVGSIACAFTDTQ